ncbi:MAG: hypothetical protein LBV17_10235 [Treponema sp.]|jgi:hypothetical protein|nr:hypothetical protein [Treponema sp.]
MQITLSDEHLKRIKEHIETKEPFATVEAFIEDTVSHRIENYPWFFDDICVHNDECMHSKSVKKWKGEEEKS